MRPERFHTAGYSVNKGGPVDLLPLGLQALSEHREARRLHSASARSAEALMGAARPTAVQQGGVDVFARSDDHGGECRVCTRSVESLQCLISPLPLGLGALAEQSTSEARPERSGVKALRAAGTGSSPAFLSDRWKNPRLGLRTARKR